MALQQTSFKTDWPVNVKRRGWVGADIDKERQSFDLGPEQSAALRELVSKHMAAGTPYRAVSREQFSHSALDSFLARMVEELKWGKGVVFLRGVSIDSYTLDELRMLYWGIGTHFGMALCQKKFTGEYMLDITPKREIMQGYSGRQE